MLSKVQYKRLDDKGVVPFKVKEDVVLELYSDNENKHKDTKYFSANGTFYGELVAVKVYPVKNGLIDRDFISGVGLMIENESKDGYWIVPANKCIPLDGEIEVENSVNSVDEVFEKPVRKEFKTLNEEPKKVLGFTYKQLLIIGLIALVVRKL